MSATTTAMGSFYDQKRAASQLRSYREKGPIPSTRALIEALEAEGVEGATLLDIGGGVGAIQHDLLDAGVAEVTSIDASAAYIDAARSESERRGHQGRVNYVHSDFTELADSIPTSDIVTLDRVINVYPDWERLLELAAARDSPALGTRLSARHAHDEARRLRNESEAAPDSRAGARSHPPTRCNRTHRPRKRSCAHVAQDIGPAWHVAIFRRA